MNFLFDSFHLIAQKFILIRNTREFQDYLLSWSIQLQSIFHLAFLLAAEDGFPSDWMVDS